MALSKEEILDTIAQMPVMDVVELIEAMEDSEDVQNVYSNADFDEELIQ